MNDSSDFQIECQILSDLYMNYRDSDVFSDFIEYNDIGVPLAHFMADGLIKELEPIAKTYIAETYQLLFDALSIPVTHEYESLDELLEAAREQ